MNGRTMSNSVRLKSSERILRANDPKGCKITCADRFLPYKSERRRYNFFNPMIFLECLSMSSRIILPFGDQLAAGKGIDK